MSVADHAGRAHVFSVAAPACRRPARAITTLRAYSSPSRTRSREQIGGVTRAVIPLFSNAIFHSLSRLSALNPAPGASLPYILRPYEY